jgi:hypothetical protein
MVGKYSKNLGATFKLCEPDVTCQFHTEDQQMLCITAKEFSRLARGIYAPLFDAVL